MLPLDQGRRKRAAARARATYLIETRQSVALWRRRWRVATRGCHPCCHLSSRRRRARVEDSRQTIPRLPNHRGQKTYVYSCRPGGARARRCPATPVAGRGIFTREKLYGSESPYSGVNPGSEPELPYHHLAWLACGPWRTHKHNTYDHVAWQASGRWDHLAHQVVGRQRHTMVWNGMVWHGMGGGGCTQGSPRRGRGLIHTTRKQQLIHTYHV